jgi:hypothetical protein
MYKESITEDGMGFLKNGKSPTFFLALFPSFQCQVGKLSCLDLGHFPISHLLLPKKKKFSKKSFEKRFQKNASCDMQELHTPFLKVGECNT